MGSTHAARALQVFSKVPLLAGLDSSVLEAIAQVATPQHHGAGQVIYLEGEPATAVYVLESGWVKAARMSPDGREQALSVLKPMEVFGDIAVFSNTPYPGTVIALEDVDVWAIDGAALRDLVTRYPELASAVIRHLARRVLYFIELVEDLSLRNVEARLAKTLLKNAQSVEGQLVIPRRQWTTFDEMATRLGTVRDVLSRALRALEAEGLLKVERHRILLLDPEGLARRGQPS